MCPARARTLSRDGRRCRDATLAPDDTPVQVTSCSGSTTANRERILARP